MGNFFCAVYFEKNISEPAWYPGHTIKIIYFPKAKEAFVGHDF